MNSFEPNHAAEPPVSRMSVPVCPSHKPRKPVVLTTVLTTSIGPGSFATCVVFGGAVPVNCTAGIGETEGGGAASICTCILHFTNSIGVLRKRGTAERKSNGRKLRILPPMILQGEGGNERTGQNS